MILDMHCDTILRIKENPDRSLLSNDLMVDIRKMKQGNYLLQNFALFVHRRENSDAYEDCQELYRCFCDQMDRYPDQIRQVTTLKEIAANEEAGLLSALLTIEEGAVCRGNAELLKEFYDKGVRMMTLTWNYENEIGFPNCTIDAKGQMIPCTNTENGLKPKGFEIIEAMESMGMIVDVSHLSDGGFMDVASHLTVPFVASHSNCRTVCPHPRNLTDEMIRILGEKGGVSGLNVFGAFVNPKMPSGHMECRIEDLLKHAHHMADVGGIDCVAMGTDYDGFKGKCEIPTAADMAAWPEYLHQSGFSWDEVDKITYKNALRVYGEVLK